MSSEFDFIPRVERGERSLADDVDVYDDDDVYWTRYKRPVTGEYVWAWDVDEDGGEYHAFTEEQRERFLELEERIAACHDDTQAKLYEFVLQNRILFGFDGAEQTMQTI